MRTFYASGKMQVVSSEFYSHGLPCSPRSVHPLFPLEGPCGRWHRAGPAALPGGAVTGLWVLRSTAPASVSRESGFINSLPGHSILSVRCAAPALNSVPCPQGARLWSRQPRCLFTSLEGWPLTVSSHFGASGQIVKIYDEGCLDDGRGLLVV